MNKYKSSDGQRTIELKDGFTFVKVIETKLLPLNAIQTQEISIERDKVERFKLTLLDAGWKPVQIAGWIAC